MFAVCSSEIYEWRRLRYDYEFLVDHTAMEDSGMNVNIDMTIAMECKCKIWSGVANI